MSDTTNGIDRLAKRLLDEGYASNEVDANLAAIKIILAADSRHEREPGKQPRTGKLRLTT